MVVELAFDVSPTATTPRNGTGQACNPAVAQFLFHHGRLNQARSLAFEIPPAVIADAEAGAVENESRFGADSYEGHGQGRMTLSLPVRGLDEIRPRQHADQRRHRGRCAGAQSISYHAT